MRHSHLRSRSSLSGLIALLNRHALAHRDSLALDEFEQFDTATAQWFWTLSMIVPTISVILAATLPDGLIAVAGMFYGVYGILSPWFYSRRSRQRERLQA